MVEQTEQRNPLRGVLKNVERENRELHKRLAEAEAKISQFTNGQQDSGQEAKALRAAQRRGASLFESAAHVNREVSVLGPSGPDEPADSGEVDDEDDDYSEPSPDEIAAIFTPDERADLGLPIETEAERMAREEAESLEAARLELEAERAEEAALHESWLSEVGPAVRAITQSIVSTPPPSFPTGTDAALVRIQDTRSSAELAAVLKTVFPRPPRHLTQPS